MTGVYEDNVECALLVGQEWQKENGGTQGAGVPKGASSKGTACGLHKPLLSTKHAMANL